MQVTKKIYFSAFCKATSKSDANIEKYVNTTSSYFKFVSFIIMINLLILGTKSFFDRKITSKGTILIE